MTAIIKYIKERFKIRIYLPLCFLLTIGSEFSGLYNIDKIEIIKRIVTALLLLLWFRLWDDLCSIEKDRKIEPERITVNPLYTKSLWMWFFVLSLISFLLISIFYNTVVTTILIILAVFFILIYSFHKKINTLHFDLIVLIKYPVIAYIISSEETAFKEKILPLVMIYLIIVVYEIFHDKEHRLDSNYLRIGFFAWIAMIIGFVFLITLHSCNF